MNEPRRLRVVALMVGLAACGYPQLPRIAGDGGDTDAGSEADASIDAPPFMGTCNPDGPACANCRDDDGDGRIDGFDPECTGAFDGDEQSFATRIPGDNLDAVKQDCFFDGNTGSGDDTCNEHVCCILGATTATACPIGTNSYNPADCPPPIGGGTVTDTCRTTCGKLLPPGCDCFGCCTLCDPTTSQCADVFIHPLDSVGCSALALSDPDRCRRCTKSSQCGTSQCGGNTCILCPGQDPSVLPAACLGMNKCPNNEPTCTIDSTCPTSTYCANGCCIGVIR